MAELGITRAHRECISAIVGILPVHLTKGIFKLKLCICCSEKDHNYYIGKIFYLYLFKYSQSVYKMFGKVFL